MKKDILLCLTLLAAAQAAAQGDVVSYILEYNGNTLNSRTNYIYDTQGRLVEALELHPGESGELENYARHNYGYDALGRRSVVENYLWDDNTLQFYGIASDDGAKTVTTFDDSGRPSQVLYYQWATSGGWGADDQWKYNGTFEYDGYSATETRKEQVNGIPKADPSAFVYYTYNEQWRVTGKVKSLYLFDFTTYDYMETPTDRWKYEYDDHGNVTLEEQYTYLGGSGDDYDPWGASPKAAPEIVESDWARLYSYRYEYTYDQQGNIATKKRYSWDDFEVDYVLTYDFRYEYHYGSNDALELDYSNNFDTDDALAAFTIEDGNADGQSWSVSNGAATCTSSAASDGPEILYLPAIRFSTDYEVEISFQASVADAAVPAQLQMILCSNDDERTPLGPIGQIWAINSTVPVTVTGLVVPEANSPYVVGICFDNAQVGATLIIDNLAVRNRRSTATPMPPYSLTATPASDGSLEVELMWYPSPYTIAGDYINAVDCIEVYRDGVEEPLYTTDRVGTTLAQRFIDTTVPAAGEYTYRVYSIIGDMRSDAAVVTVQVGYAVPAEMEGFKAVENADHSVTLSWNAPAETDGDVRYYILRNNSEILATDLAGTSFTDSGIDTSAGQTYCYYMVQPYNAAGYGPRTYSELLFVGEPLAAPFAESFAGGAASHQWMNEIVNGYDAAWGVGSGVQQGIDPQDSDGGLAAFLSTQLAEGDVVRFTSEKIDISTLAAPELSFYMYHLAGDVTGDALVVEASTDNGPFATLAGPLAAAGAEQQGWQQHTVALTDLAGEKNVRLSFRGIAGATHNIYIDHITVAEQGESSIGGGNTLAANARVWAAGGQIIVEAAKASDIRVHALDGSLVYATHAAKASVPATSGIYIVTIDAAATKVAVR